MEAKNQNQLFDIKDLDNLFCDLIDIVLLKTSDGALSETVNCIFQFLSEKKLHLNIKLFEKLMSIITLRYDGLAHSYQKLHLIVHCILSYVKYSANESPSSETKYFLSQLWSLCVNSGQPHPYAGHILLQLFDLFVREELVVKNCPQLLLAIENLSQSVYMGNRKRAFCLMEKLTKIYERPEIANALKCTKQQWSDYIQLLIHMESQTERNLLKSNPFQTDNIPLLKRIINYMLSFPDLFSISKLSRSNLLADFLAVTNRNELYIEEEENGTLLHFTKLIGTNHLEILIQAIITFGGKWNSIPFVHWMHSMPIAKSSISDERMHGLALRVSQMDDSELRQVAIKRVFELFKITLDELSLGQYMIFVESLYQSQNNDEYKDQKRLQQKIKNCQNIESEIVYFNKRCFEIVFNHTEMIFYDYDNTNVAKEFIKQLQKLPKSQHGWWRLFPLFLTEYKNTDDNIFLYSDDCENSEEMEIDDYYYEDPGFSKTPQPNEIYDFYSTEYNVDTSLLLKCNDYKTLQLHLIDKLMCESDEEKSFVMQHCVDLFVKNNISDWLQMEKMHLKPLELLEQGSGKTFMHLTYIMKKCTQRLEDDSIFSELLKHMKRFPYYSIINNILDYAKKYLTIEENISLGEDLVHENCYHEWISLVLRFEISLPISLVIQQILQQEALNGDARPAYKRNYKDLYYRNAFLRYTEQNTNPYANKICLELLRKNIELNDRCANYFTNSQEHILQIRIARALLYLKNKLVWTDYLWSALFAVNDQVNITYMYECLVALCLPSLDPILERLELASSLQINQQISLISVAHIFCKVRQEELEENQMQKLYNLLLRLANTEDSKIGTYVQLVLSKLCENVICFTSIHSNGSKKFTSNSFVDSWTNVERTARLLLPELASNAKFSNECVADFILFMTNASFDEHELAHTKNNIEILECRSAFKAKRNRFTLPQDVLSAIKNEEMKSDLTSQDTSENNPDLIVVAALNDDFPNQNDLISVCQVLGVKTFVLSDNTKFRFDLNAPINVIRVNPSLIAEFLFKKRVEDYKIIGVKQSSQYTKNVDITLPKKTVLLLGHEKQGISENLFCFLDYTIEMPQIGIHNATVILLHEFGKQQSKET